MSPNSSHHAWWVAIVLIVCTAGTAGANVQPAAIFASHMVLQRDRPIPIWGMAAPGETVTVSFVGETVETTADEQGRWRVRLPA